MAAKPKIGIVIHQEMHAQLFAPETIARLEEVGEIVWTESVEPLTTDAAAVLLQGCEIGVGSWRTPGPDAVLLARCPDLRLWIHAAGSVKGFFGPHMDGRDITIASCAPAIADGVAEMVIGTLIVGLKRVLENAAANREGKSPKPANSKTLFASTVGVIGASQVGRRVVAHLRYFGAKVLLYDPFVTGEQAQGMGVSLRHDLSDLCRESDVVTLHTPLLPATHYLIGRAQLAAMKDDAVFVNCSRGGCVDEAALIEELAKGRFFAYLDVSDPEPAADDSPLRTLPNVVYTSHIAGGAQHRIGQQVADDIENWLAGRPVTMAVTADMRDRLA